MLSETDNSSWYSSLTSKDLRSYVTLGLRGRIPVICFWSKTKSVCVWVCVL